MRWPLNRRIDGSEDLLRVARVSVRTVPVGMHASFRDWVIARQSFADAQHDLNDIYCGVQIAF